MNLDLRTWLAAAVLCVCGFLFLVVASSALAVTPEAQHLFDRTHKTAAAICTSHMKKWGGYCGISRCKVNHAQSHDHKHLRATCELVGRYAYIVVKGPHKGHKHIVDYDETVRGWYVGGPPWAVAARSVWFFST